MSKLGEVLSKYEEESLRTYGGQLYSGILEELQTLRKDYLLFIVSNCQAWYLDFFIDRYNLGHIFKDSELTMAVLIGPREKISFRL